MNFADRMIQLFFGIITIMWVATLVMLITSCASVTTIDRYADGRTTETHAFEIGRTEMISDFHDTTTKNGRDIGIGNASADVNVEALKAGGATLGQIIGTAVKAAAGVP